MISVTW